MEYMVMMCYKTLKCFYDSSPRTSRFFIWFVCLLAANLISRLARTQPVNLFSYSHPLEQRISFWTFGVLPVDGNRNTFRNIHPSFTQTTVRKIFCACDSVLTQSYPVLTDILNSSVTTRCVLSIYLGVLLTVCLLSCSINHGHDLTFISGIDISSVTFSWKVVRCGVNIDRYLFPAVSYVTRV
jgi:general stress protein CsbA